MLFDLEHGATRISRAGRSLWSVSSAADRNWSLLPTQPASFARAGALIARGAGRLIRSGVEESPLNADDSSRHQNGNKFAIEYGPETKVSVGDAESAIVALRRCITSTTSGVGDDTRNSAKHFDTLCSYVVAAIAGLIQKETDVSDSFAVELEVVEGYTLIDFRGKPAADGPRYKSLGNAMNVKDIRWILQRIEKFERLKR